MNIRVYSDCRLIKSGTDFRDLSSASLELASTPDGSIRRKIIKTLTGKHHYILPSSPSSEPVEKLLKSLLSSVEGTLSKPVCFTLSPFDARSELVRTQETGLGNWMADVLMHAYAESLIEGGRNDMFEKAKSKSESESVNGDGAGDGEKGKDGGDAQEEDRSSETKTAVGENEEQRREEEQDQGEREKAESKRKAFVHDGGRDAKGGADAVIICGGTLRGDSQYGPGKITLGDILGESGSRSCEICVLHIVRGDKTVLMLRRDTTV